MAKEREFNISGPMKPEIHYCVNPLKRVDEEEVFRLIDGMKYFVLHAPRQSGKTTLLLALAARLNAESRYGALYINVEAAQAARENVALGMRAIVAGLAAAAQNQLGDSWIAENQARIFDAAGEMGVLAGVLSEWSRNSPKPVVLFIDEIDSLVGDTLVSVLRQLRSNYHMRPLAFPQSVVLCGVRDVKDYRINTGKEGIVYGGSCFNIKDESLRLGGFTQDEIRELYGQHTDETGQVFEDGVFPAVWNMTRGQPWLVNALARQVTWKMEMNRDRARAITLTDIVRAKEELIQARMTHLDQLGDKLREERVRRVIIPLLSGDGTPEILPDDDIQYVEDLGLISRDRGLYIANDIYREIIPRQLTYSTQRTMAQETAWYVTPGGRLDMRKLLTAFQEFFRENSDIWLEKFDYKEAGPQLLLQAFLQRVVNGGGIIDREYGLGRKRTDLFIRWPYGTYEAHGEGQASRTQKIVIELKLAHKGPAAAIKQGVEQTAEYADLCGAEEAHLMVFDRRPKISWSKKIFVREEKSAEGRSVTLWGC